MQADFVVPDEVLDAFGLGGAHIELLTGGRTNRTMRARAGRDVVLQQLLGSAGADLLGIMENLVRVTSHLDWRGAMVEGAPEPGWYPALLSATNGKPFLLTPEGDVWRAFAYRPGQILRTRQPLGTLASAGALYGRFSAETADFDGPPLLETAPGFHDLDRVYDSLMSEVHDREGERARRDVLLPELVRLEQLKALVDERCALDGLAAVADRVVHNDTKLSNVLFDRTHGRAVAVLDLDLVMMGPSWHDVGDLLRSASWHAPDMADSEPMCTSGLFDAVVGAYVESAGDTLADADITTYAAAGPRLSLELGLRYLHDHLRAEPHLRVPGQHGHLRRGLANVKLAEEMLGAYDALRPIADQMVGAR